jgi:hypothetical protein
MSENVGMSSERGVRISSAECPRVPGEGSSAQGKSGPKARPRGVVDGQQVDIPVPLYARPGRIWCAKESPSGPTDPASSRPAMG